MGAQRLEWIRSEKSLGDHPKTKRAAKMLSVSMAAIVGHLHYLWWWAMQYAPDGHLGRFGHDEIADAARWDGDPDQFVEVLLKCGPGGSVGFLEEDGDGIRIHDWSDYAEKLIQQREKDIARYKRWREDKKRTGSQPVPNPFATRSERETNDVTNVTNERNVTGDTPPISPPRGVAPGGAGELFHPGSDQRPAETVDAQRECAKTAPAGMPGPGQQAGEGAVMGEIPQEEPAAPTAGKAVVKMPGYPADFEACWAIYPRQIEKQAAFKAWRARLKEGYTAKLLLACSGNYAESCRLNGTEPGYVKHPKTFFGPTRPFLDYRDSPIVEHTHQRKGNGNGRSADHDNEPMDWEDRFWQK